MTPRQEAQARQVEQLARWTLVMLAKVEQGLLPAQVLARTVEPQVLGALGPITVDPGQTRLRPEVGRIRVDLADEHTAHVAAVARRPDGRHAGYVLELNRDSLDGRWRVCELTRADQRQLTGPERRLVGRADRDGFQHLPDDLDPLIARLERARGDARDRIDQADQQLARIRRQREATPRGRDDHHDRLRAALAGEEHTLTRTRDRWNRQLRRLNEAHRELVEVRELRELKTAVLDRDPLLGSGSPDHLERVLGPLPDDPAERAAWRESASAVERRRRELRLDPAELTRELADGMVAAEPPHLQNPRLGARPGRTLEDVRERALPGWGVEPELER